MTVLALSRHLSFHARGDAAYVWHGLTGDVAEMSRDVLGLMLAFEPAADEAAVMKSPPAGLTAAQVEEFVPILRARRMLVSTGIAGRSTDELAPLLVGFPRIPRGAVVHRRGARVTLYGRSGAPLELDPTTAALFARVDGERTLGQVLGDAGPAALPALLRLARADVAALKILAKPVSQGGVQLNPAAESTMPYPELPDVRAYVAGGPAPSPTRSDDDPRGLAALFREPHPSLKGRTFATALGAGLLSRGALREVQGRPARALELGIAGFLGAQLRDALGAPRYAAVAPFARKDPQLAVARGEPRLLPARRESLDLVVANELAGALGTGHDESGARIVNHGALQLVREAATALAPGGVLFLSEAGDPKGDPVASDDGTWTVRFADVQTEATKAGLGAKVLPLADVLGLDVNPQALSTTRASFPALRALFAAHGLDLTRRAWLRSEIEQLCAGKLDLTEVHGLQWAPLSERALGLSPRHYWALVATKPPRTLH